MRTTKCSGNVKKLVALFCIGLQVLLVGCSKASKSKASKGVSVSDRTVPPTHPCKMSGPCDARVEHYSAQDFFAGTSVLPLCEAIEKGDEDAVKKQLQVGLDLSEQGKFGITPIMWAFLFGYYDVVEELAASGASVDNRLTDDLVGKKTTTYFKGDSIIFMFARYTPQQDRLMRLLKYSSDANQVDSFGCTVLHYYLGQAMLNPPHQTVNEYRKDISEFVAHGLDVNAKLRSGDTPLHLALKNNPLQCIALLLNSAAPDLVDAEGKTFNERVKEEVEALESKGRRLRADDASDRVRALYELTKYLESFDR